MSVLRLALAYLRFHWARSMVLTLVAALIIATPLGVSRLIAASEARMTARAEATPLLIGARGSRLDLAMAALYFSDERPGRITMQAAEAVWDSGLADALPLHLGFRAEGARIVGATFDYFAFHGLQIVEGRPLALLGEAVLGAAVARRLGRGPGDAIVSSPENLFDLAGVYPLRMPIVGVLAETGGPDDAAVFVDLKTAWVIEGIGHGHDDVAPADGGGAALADPALVAFREVTPETIDSFHFHGDPADYPIDAVIAAPLDARSAAILRGRYLDRDNPLQIVEPAEVVGGLFESVFRVKAVLDAVVAVVAGAAALAVGLAVFLSLQLRRREMETAFRLGGRRATVAWLVATESVILLCLAFILALAILTVTEGAMAPLAASLVAAV